MDPAISRARDRLHPSYVRALDLAAAGATTQEVAEDLGIGTEAVDSLLRLAEEKLRAAVDHRTDAG